MGVLVLSKRWDTWKLLESTRALSRPSLFPSFSLFLFFFLISFRGHSMKPSPGTGGGGQKGWKEQIWLKFPLSGWVLPSWAYAAGSWAYAQLISFQKFAAVGEKSVPPWADSASNPSRFSVPKGDLTRNPYIRLKNNQKEIPHFLF